jgi:hypothetical protein
VIGKEAHKHVPAAIVLKLSEIDSLAGVEALRLSLDGGTQKLNEATLDGHDREALAIIFPTRF